MAQAAPGLQWPVRFDVGRLEAARSLELWVRLPVGIVNHEVIVLAPVDAGHTRVTFN